MAIRKDGQERKALLLETATKVFAEKGFRDTTIADICEAAHSNTASVNYYFGSKDELYAEVWKNAFSLAMEKYPPDMGLGSDAEPEDRLRALVRSFLYKMLDTGQLGYAGHLLMMELANPTDAIDHIKRDAIEPLQKRTKAILRRLLGEQVSERNVEFCAMSIIHQCMGFGFHRGKLPLSLHESGTAELHETLSEHITRFSLAGLAAVKERTIVSG